MTRRYQGFQSLPLEFEILSVTLDSSLSLYSPVDRLHLTTLWMIKRWKRLVREAVETPSLEVLKTQLDTVLSSLLQLIMLSAGQDGLDDPFPPHPLFDTAIHFSMMLQKIWEGVPWGSVWQVYCCFSLQYCQHPTQKQFGTLNAEMLTQDETFAIGKRTFLK